MLVFCFIKNWDEIKAKVAELRDWIVEKVTAIKDGIANAFSAALETVKQWIKNTVTLFKASIAGFVDIGKKHS